MYIIYLYLAMNCSTIAITLYHMLTFEVVYTHTYLPPPPSPSLSLPLAGGLRLVCRENEGPS